jgi:hypothetical protein
MPGTLIAHWNGHTWQRATAPSPTGGSVLTAAAASSGHSAWAVGYTRGSGKTIILRWNGTFWSRVASPTPAHGGELLGTGIGSSASAWAVGSSDFGNLLLERWNGHEVEVTRAGRKPSVRAATPRTPRRPGRRRRGHRRWGSTSGPPPGCRRPRAAEPGPGRRAGRPSGPAGAAPRPAPGPRR